MNTEVGSELRLLGPLAMSTSGRVRSTAQVYVVTPTLPALSFAVTSSVCVPLDTWESASRPFRHPTAFPSTVHLAGPTISSSGSNRKVASSLRVADGGAEENAMTGPVASTRKNHPAAGSLTSSVRGSRARTSNWYAPGGSSVKLVPAGSHGPHAAPTLSGTSRHWNPASGKVLEYVNDALDTDLDDFGCVVSTTSGPDDATVNAREAGVGSTRPSSEMPATWNTYRPSGRLLIASNPCGHECHGFAAASRRQRYVAKRDGEKKLNSAMRAPIDGPGPVAIVVCRRGVIMAWRRDARLRCSAAILRSPARLRSSCGSFARSTSCTEPSSYSTYLYRCVTIPSKPGVSTRPPL